MKKMFKGFLASSVALVAILPAFAGVTDLTIKASTPDFFLLRLETTDALPVVVSKDDIDDGSVLLPGVHNEVLDFGTVDAMGFNDANTESRIVNSDNGTHGSIKMKFIDTDKKIASSDQGSIKRAGTIYYLEGALSLRVIKSDVLNKKSESDIDVENTEIGTESLNALISGGDNQINWSDGTAITNVLLTPNQGPTTFMGNCPNNVAQPIDVGIYIPLDQKSGDKKTVLTFTGTHIDM